MLWNQLHRLWDSCLLQSAQRAHTGHMSPVFCPTGRPSGNTHTHLWTRLPQFCYVIFFFSKHVSVTFKVLYKLI